MPALNMGIRSLIEHLSGEGNYLLILHSLHSGPSLKDTGNFTKKDNPGLSEMLAISGNRASEPVSRDSKPNIWHPNANGVDPELPQNEESHFADREPCASPVRVLP